MRIAFVTQFFQPEPFFKGLPFARALADRGHHVQVLTGFPNYPGGRIYPGYCVRLWQREVLDGIPVLRVPLYPSHDRSGLRRTLNYLSFACSATALGTPLLERPDVIYAYHPPATSALPAIALSLIAGAPIVYDIQDLWPDSVLHSGMLANGLTVGAISAWCRFVYRRASRIVVLSPGFKRVLRDRGVPSAKISVVYNWADESPVEAATVGSKTLPQDRFNIVFAGTMGAGQALGTVLRVAHQCAAVIPSAHFWLVGRGTETEQLQRKAAEIGLSNVTFLPHQPRSELMSIMDAADALLVHLRNIPLYTVTIPSKTQAYLAAGKPIIMAVRGDSADLVTEAGAGINCEPEDADSITAAIAKLFALGPEGRRSMGAAGLAYYQAHLCFSRGLDRFESIFESAVRAYRGGRGQPIGGHSPEETN